MSALFAVRWALLLALRGRSGWAPRWVRRIAVVALLLPAVRLFTVAAWRPDHAVQIVAFAAAILAAGGMLLAIDAMVADRLRGAAPRR